jgi:hypothetical protein
MVRGGRGESGGAVAVGVAAADSGEAESLAKPAAAGGIPVGWEHGFVIRASAADAWARAPPLTGCYVPGAVSLGRETTTRRRLLLLLPNVARLPEPTDIFSSLGNRTLGR